MKKFIFRSVLCISLALPMVKPLLGKNQKSISRSESGETLNLILGRQEAPSLHPFAIRQNTDSNSLYLYFLTSQIVFVPDGQNRWTCQLCETFPTFANGQIELLEEPDQPFNMKISVSLKKGLHWGDGKKITGRDFYFTWQVAKNLEGDFFGKSMFDRIEHLVVDDNDPLKITLYLKENEYLHSDWGCWVILPESLEKPIWSRLKETPQEYLKESHFSKDPFNPGLYSGMYIPTKSSRGRKTFKRNSWYGSYPGSFGTIQVKEKKSSIPAKGAVIVSESFCNQLSCDGLGKGLREYVGESTFYEQIALNMRNPILRDQRVRQALFESLSRDYIYDKVWNKDVAAAWNFLPTASPYFDLNVKFINYNPENARILLDQSEWLEPSGPGKRTKFPVRKKQGKPLSLSLVTTNNSKRIATAKFLIKSWEKVGVKVDLEVQSENDFFNKTLSRLDFSGMAMFAWDLPVDVSLNSVFSSQSVPNIKNSYRGQNVSAWMHHSTDRTLSRLRREFDFQNRKKLLNSLQKNYAEDIPSIPLFFYLHKAFVSKDVHGFQLPENSFPSSLLAHKWKSG